MGADDDPVLTDPVLTDHDKFDPIDRFEITSGDDIGGYIVEGELGRGGMGVVYSATHPVIGKRAAIKVLKPSLSNNPATIERFIQEARSVNQIGHPNIVDIFAFDALPDGRRYMVMDLLEGESLRKRLKRGPLPVLEAAIVIDELASALVAAHDKGFIHRDLKPDNVFLVENPGRFDVRLLDFGLAKLMPTAQLTSDRAFRTATGAQLGTPDYMSPEQLRGTKDVDHRTDIYALGVMAFEIITGTRPRRGPNGVLDIGGTPTEIVGRVKHVPTELAQLVETMLAPEPDHRPSLVAVRAVIKRVRPSLPSIETVDPMRTLVDGDPSFSLTPSMVGARPMLRTPPTGAPFVPEVPPPAPLAPEVPPPPPPLRIPTTPHYSQPPMMAAGLRSLPQGTPKTKFGVPPPPEPGPQSRTRPLTPPRRRRTWLVVVAALVIAAGVAVAVVIAL